MKDSKIQKEAMELTPNEHYKRDANLDKSKKAGLIIIGSIIVLTGIWVFFGNETQKLPFHQ